MNQPHAYVKQLPQGFSLIELLMVVAVGGGIMVALGDFTHRALQAEALTRERNALMQEARFAMQRMVSAVRGTQRALLPRPENPATAWSESVREVLAVTLDPTIDRNGDGWADANNDKDFMDLNNNLLRDAGEPERIDEDPGGDVNNDAAPGIKGIDDDGDSSVDEQHTSPGPLNEDDDEDGAANEDAWNGADDDNDQMFDEDPKKDMNGDGLPGLGSVDDDGDGLVDEGDKNDDDEDGLIDEDWLDGVVYYLNGSDLIERLPALVDTDGDLLVTGVDYIENVIAANVSQFRVEYIAQGLGRAALIDITLVITNSAGIQASLQTSIRVGAY